MQLRLLAFVLVSSLLASCSSGPKEEELRARYTGLFCDGHYKLELKADGTYMCRRIYPGMATGAPVSEKCEGKYTFAQEGKQWKIVYDKSTENSNPMVSCSGSQILWDGKAYIAGTDSVAELEELFEKRKVRKNQCD